MAGGSQIDVVADARLNLLSSSFKVQGGISITSAGLVADFLLKTDTGAPGTVGLAGFHFDGEFRFQINTTQSLTRVFLTGSLALQLGGVDVFGLNGTFGFTMDGSALRVTMTANLVAFNVFALLGNTTVAVTGQLNLGSQGLYGVLDSQASAVFGQSGFQLSGATHLRINTTASPQASIPALSVLLAVNGRLRISPGAPAELSLNGAFMLAAHNGCPGPFRGRASNSGANLWYNCQGCVATRFSRRLRRFQTWSRADLSCRDSRSMANCNWKSTRRRPSIPCLALS